MMEYVVETNALSKRYGTFYALRGCTMKVEKGAIYGFVGKNGAGKTTLIRILCGLQEPTEGDYTLYGINSQTHAIAKARKRIGAVVETPSIYLDMSARDNLKQQYELLGLPSFDHLDDILSLVGLADTGKRKAKDFSLGMRQRLGIAIALVGDPDFLILDEPTNGLDPQGIIEIRELILKLNQEQQITVLISSHILEELSKLATHYGFIDHGRIVKEMSAVELQEACRKCMRVEVTNIKALIYVLDEMEIKYKLLSDTQADIYSEIPVSQLVLALDKVHCEILRMHTQDENLESYFVHLVGGESHA